MGSAPDNDSGPSNDNDTGGAREQEEAKANEESFNNSLNNSQRPDREPSASLTNDARPDREPAATPEDPGNDNRPPDPEGGDTTPSYSGPNPDPRGPALDTPPEDTQDNDKPASSTNPGGLPNSDTTPNYTGPNPDPRGPVLSGGENKPTDMEVAIGSRFGPMAPAIVAAGTVAVADGPLPIGDIIGMGIIGYAGYRALTNPPPAGPLLNESAETEEPGKTVGGRDVGDLTASGLEPDPADKSGELTKAGRAIDKHGNRPGSVFDKPTGTPADKNAQGQKALDDIVNDEGATVKEGNRFGGFDVYGSDGRGARFDDDGKFQGFLEP